MMVLAFILVVLPMVANTSANVNPNHVHGDNSVGAMFVSISLPTLIINSGIGSYGCTI